MACSAVDWAAAGRLPLTDRTNAASAIGRPSWTSSHMTLKPVIAQSLLAARGYRMRQEGVAQARWALAQDPAGVASRGAAKPPRFAVQSDQGARCRRDVPFSPSGAHDVQAVAEHGLDRAGQTALGQPFLRRRCWRGARNRRAARRSRRGLIRDAWLGRTRRLLRAGWLVRLGLFVDRARVSRDCARWGLDRDTSCRLWPRCWLTLAGARCARRGRLRLRRSGRGRRGGWRLGRGG